jgi:Type III secretion needle MxiH, YscF, SsaG, EprI, PscF, EscF
MAASTTSTTSTSTSLSDIASILGTAATNSEQALKSAMDSLTAGTPMTMDETLQIQQLMSQQGFAVGAAAATMKALGDTLQGLVQKIG